MQETHLQVKDFGLILEAILKFLKNSVDSLSIMSILVQVTFAFYLDFYCVLVSLRPFQGYKNETKNHANTSLGKILSDFVSISYINAT